MLAKIIGNVKDYIYYALYLKESASDQSAMFVGSEAWRTGL